MQGFLKMWGRTTGLQRQKHNAVHSTSTS